MNFCKSCGAEIIWAVTENGKRMPLDAQPINRPSCFVLNDREDPPVAVVAKGPSVYVSHFATCPNADQHRKPR
jgi:hypothetical protein